MLIQGDDTPCFSSVYVLVAYFILNNMPKDWCCWPTVKVEPCVRCVVSHLGPVCLSVTRVSTCLENRENVKMSANLQLSVNIFNHKKPSYR